MFFPTTRAFRPRLPDLKMSARLARELSRPAKASLLPFLTRPSHALGIHWPKSTFWLESRLKKLSPLWKAIQMCIRSEEHTSELQSRGHLVCRLLLETKI